YTSNSSIQTLKILANFGYYIIVLLFLVSAIKRIGLDLSSLSIIVGALSVGIGFGLKELISNFVSGIILMLERAIKIGDFIEISSDMQGVVTDIRMRATTIKTIGNVDVIVPNSKIIQNSMINHTMEDTRRRLIVPFSVGYETAHERVEELVLNALMSSEFNYIKDEDKKPIVTIVNLAKDGVEYKLLAWVHEDKVVAKSNYFKLILKTLRDSGVNIAHQQVDLHVVKEEI
ncbi:MAG: mechanosensitive ion channel, partial [Campylobacterota bacterium]|nr:mechanosensitive ion channel [Campylobacterota bacterium]